MEKMFCIEVLATEVANTGEGLRDNRRFCHWTVVYATTEEKARLTVMESYARNRYWVLEEIGCVKEINHEQKEKLEACTL